MDYSYDKVDVNEPLLDTLKQRSSVELWCASKKYTTPFLYLNLAKATLNTWNLNSCNVMLDYNKTTSERVVLTGTLLKCPIVLELVLSKSDGELAKGTFRFGTTSIYNVLIKR